MKHMVLLSFQVNGDVISANFLRLRLQMDSLNTVGLSTFRTSRGGSGFLSKIVDLGGSK